MQTKVVGKGYTTPVYLSQPASLINFIQQLHHQQACPITCDDFKDASLELPVQLAGGATEESPLTSD